MNRNEFLSSLSRLLEDLPENERLEALQYYNDYLDDAGAENEQEVLEALGTPQKLAESIREGLGDGGRQYREGQPAERGSAAYDENRKKNGRQNRTKKNSRMSTGMIIFIVICCVCAAPVLVPVVFAVAVTAAALLFAAVVTAAALLAAGSVCIVAGIIALAVAVIKLFAAPAGAMVAIGIGLMIIGGGLLLVLGMGWLIGNALPAVFKGCVALCRRIFVRKGGNAG